MTATPSPDASPYVPTSHRLRARTALPATALGAALLLVWRLLDAVTDGAPAGLLELTAPMAVAGLVLLVVGLAALLLPRRTAGLPVRAVASPVQGPWGALNSPTTRVPSHGTHGYGQTFAVDLVAEPDDGSRPAFGSGRAFRPPQDFPAFGRPVLAPAAGRVVSAHDGARDHLSRSTWPAVAYLMAEGVVRELTGTLLGNRVVLDLGDGSYCLLAHLRRGSVSVRAGDVVQPGDQVGECGNSGSSSEPHLHVHLMDHGRPSLAAGVPIAFRDVEVDGVVVTGVPANGGVMRASTSHADRRPGEGGRSPSPAAGPEG